MKSALLAVALLGGAATSALAAGSISGSVCAVATCGSGGSVPLAGSVQFYAESSNADGPSFEATIDGSGNYTQSLPDDTYYVITQNTGGYINKIWNNIACSAVCDVNSITGVVVSGGAVTAINFVLTPGVTISGNITGTTGGVALAGIKVYFADSGPNVFFASAITDGAGNFTSNGGSAPGNIFVLTSNALGYLDEVYDNIKCPGTNCDVGTGPGQVGTPVAITGVPKTGVNFVLDTGGRISGHVQDSMAAPLVGVKVKIEQGNGSFVNNVDEVFTDGSGNFLSHGLASGNYYAVTRNDLGLVDKLWNNIVCAGSQCDPFFSGGTVIAVTVPSTTSGINFTLPPGGYISGTVTNSTGGLPIADTFVGLTNSSGVFVGGSNTDDTGFYTTHGVPAGTYYAAVTNAQGFQGQVYNGIPCNGCNVVSTGTPIVVTTGTTQTGKDFSLVAGGNITGTITDPMMAPVTNYPVQIFSSSGSQLFQVNTNGSGVYTFTGLATGSYYVRTAGSSFLVQQIYNSGGNVTCLSTFSIQTNCAGSLISVTAPSTTSNINFTPPAGGKISGTVTNQTGGGLLTGVNVRVSNSAGTTQLTSTNTNGSGVYTTQALPAGASYYIRTGNSLGFMDELWDNKPCPNSSCTITAGDLIAVSASTTTTGKDFALVAGATISGQVTNFTGGLPIQNVTVQLFNSSGSGMGSVNTDSSGNYVTGGLADGTYYIRTSNSLGFVDELYNDIPCIPSCTVTTGTAIVISGGANQTGKNIALTQGGSISGTVTNANTAALLGSVNVQAYTSGGSFAKSASTNGSGVYTISGLPAGSYFVKTQSQSAGYQDELWNDKLCLNSACSVTGGDAIVVTANTTASGKNFALLPGGRISGTVTSVTGGAPIQFVSVQLYNSSGIQLGNTLTDSSGNYTTSGLPDGTYFIKTNNGSGFVDELYNDIVCIPTCTVTSGTAIVITAGGNQTGKNIALATGGSISGTVTDTTPVALGSVNVTIYTSGGFFAKSTTTDIAGAYTVAGLPPGTYYARTFVTAGQYYLDELFSEMVCGAGCSVTTGTGIVVTAGTTQTGKNFTLTPGGGSITGTVKDAGTLANISTNVQLYNSGGNFVTSVPSNNGVFSFGGVAAGTYYARTGISSFQVPYVDELYSEKQWPCVPSCLVTTGDPIVVSNGATTSGIAFTLAPNLVANGFFNSGATNWQTFALPAAGNMTTAVVGGVMQFSRDNTSTQGTVFQTTGLAFGAGVPFMATFDIGNTSNVRKYMKVLVVGDTGFSDLAACTFFLQANAPMRSYRIKVHTTAAVTDLAIYFYASSKNLPGDTGVYQVDNVSLQAAPGQGVAHTDCIDPTAPTPPGGAAGPNLLTNGDFGTNLLPPWTLFGTITADAPAGVLRMVRPTGVAPAGVIKQQTSSTTIQAMTLNQLLTATFQLGNSSGVRKRVTVIMHDNDFSDLTACVFWLAAGQPLSNYSMIGWASNPWVDATLSFYAATIGPDQYTLLDNVTFQRTPAAVTTGTTCNEPGAPSGVQPDPRVVVSAAPAGGSATSGQSFAPHQTTGGMHGVSDGGFASSSGGSAWGAVADVTGSARLVLGDAVDLRQATAAHLTFASWLSAKASQGAVQVSVDGTNWMTVGTVPASDGWQPVDVDLTDFVGEVVQVQLVFDAVAPDATEEPDSWQVDDLGVEID